ncbi:MAG: hypothetical protein N3B16_05015 [Candidatus Aminicenantes bacterium]|nr:hypothetical protein [Candidatus Aminicenantes bacterium]
MMLKLIRLRFQFLRQLLRGERSFFCFHFLIAFLLFIWGVIICLHYGRIGFMPLDQSIVFDGAWRLLCHQLPGRDFIIPYGLVPIYLQAFFFKIFGINWFSYCFHAAIFNGLFSIAIYIILILLDTPRLLSFFYALLSAIIFYPPFGVPYMDQHSWFFSILALLTAILIPKTSARSIKISLIFLNGAFFLAAFFSKPIPALFFFFIILLPILFYSPKSILRPNLLSTISSLFLIFFLVIIILWLAGFKPINFITNSILTPLGLGKERLIFYQDCYPPIVLLSALFYPKPFEPFSLRLFSYFLIYLTIVSFIIKIIILTRKSRIAALSFIKKNSNPLFMVILSLSLLIASNLFILLTLNQGENGLPILFLSLGLVHISFLKLGSADNRQPWPSKRNHNFKPVLITFIFVLTGLVDAISFNHQVNRTRIVHDMIIDPKVTAGKDSLPLELQFMKFATPSKYDFQANNLKNLVQYLKKHRANFFLLGDSSIIYGLTRRPSLNPALWFHPGLSIPYADTVAFDEYEKKLLQNLKKYRARFLVIEGKATWYNLHLDCFKRLSTLIIPNASENRHFGSFKVYRIDLAKINSTSLSY